MTRLKVESVFIFEDARGRDLKAAKIALSGLAGVYAIICNVTGAMYIGSSINMAKRLVDHVVDKDTNVHLQNAINNYGLENFVFVVVEFYEVNPSVSLETNKANLLAMEQKHLDWLFTLPESFRYNFLSTAGSSLGYTHTPETLVKMSGENNHMYGKVPASAFQPGANNHMYGKTHTPETRAKMSDSHTGITPTNAMTVNVYSIDKVLVHSFSSQVAVAQWLGINQYTVSRYIKSRKVWNNKYTFRKSS